MEDACAKVFGAEIAPAMDTHPVRAALGVVQQDGAHVGLHELGGGGVLQLVQRAAQVADAEERVRAGPLRDALQQQRELGWDGST